MARHMLENKSKYCYDDGVLINKFDIHDLELLDALSRNITTYRISQLSCNNNVIHNFFRIDDYFRLHYFLFNDIYPFAGQLRDETIYKSNAPYFTGEFNKTFLFAEPMCIVENLKRYFNKMQQDVRKINNRDDLLEYLSYYYGEINCIHPFREGNGRTLRTYIKLLVDYISSYLPAELQNLEIDYSLWDAQDREELLKATIICSVTTNSSYIKKCFDKVLVEKDLQKRKSR